MKMSPSTYEEIKTGIRAVVNFLGQDNVRAARDDTSTQSMMWQLFILAEFDYRNDDSHPAYVKGRARVVPFKAFNWSPYNEGLKDSHIETALMKIGRELDLIT